MLIALFWTFSLQTMRKKTLLQFLIPACGILLQQPEGRKAEPNILSKEWGPYYLQHDFNFIHQYFRSVAIYCCYIYILLLTHTHIFGLQSKKNTYYLYRKDSALWLWEVGVTFPGQKGNSYIWRSTIKEERAQNFGSNKECPTIATCPLYLPILSWPRTCV